MQWDIVIGLEIHTQLATRSKIFSGAATAFGAAPNTQACAIDLGLPGVLPVLNAEAVRLALRFGLAIGAAIAPRCVFARKNYFYPDLPKGYQISQYEQPIVGRGQIEIRLDDGTCKTIGVTRAHLEEDAGKSLHEGALGGGGYSGIDLNRAGTPLLEIVSEPELRSAQEAVAYARTIHQLVRWIGVSDGNMQEGSFRVDANVSIRPRGATALGTRTELKNINSFRFLERAIQFESERQIEVAEAGGQVVQETRLYDPERDETRPMRGKEEAHDYRYFPDPDLLPVVIDDALLATARATLPELPRARQARLQRDFGLHEGEAAAVTASRELADYFEAVARASGTGKLAANWVIGELSAALNRSGGLPLASAPVDPERLAGLLARIEDGTLSGKLAKQVFETMWREGHTADQVIADQGLRQMTDSAAIEALLDEIVAAHPEQAAQYRAGKEKVFAFFVGQAMKATQGKANPQQVNELLKRLLTGE